MPAPIRSELWAFIRAFGARWFIYMSGAPSVPLAVAAFFVWGGEYRARLGAEAALAEARKPRLSFIFDNSMLVLSISSEYTNRLMWTVRARIKNKSGKPICSCIVNAIITSGSGYEYPEQLCAPFSLLVDATKDIDILEYDAKDKNSRLIIPIHGRLEDNKWIHETGTGLIVDYWPEIIFEALSSDAPAVRLKLKPSASDAEAIPAALYYKPRWNFMVLNLLVFLSLLTATCLLMFPHGLGIGV